VARTVDKAFTLIKPSNDYSATERLPTTLCL
jgi:hypothetical protein